MAAVEQEKLENIPLDPVRRARALVLQAPSVEVVQEILALERPDLALEMLEKIEGGAEEREAARKVLAFVKTEHVRASGWRLWAAKLIVGFAFLLARVVFRRKVLFASMGKFTRLADLVDRIDPKLRELAGQNVRLVVLFFGGYPNEKLIEMYQRHCVIVPCTSRLTRKLGNIFVHCLKVTGRHTEITTDYRVISPSFFKNPPVLSFWESERGVLEREMERAGIDPARPFIVFGLRDMAYYKFYGDVMQIPLTKQGRRAETHHRCPPLESYIAFARHWADKGFQVVRMGLRVSETLPASMGNNVIDYAVKERSDALDAYLFAKCHFMLAGDTGLFSGAAAFDRPSVLSDLFLVRNTMYSSSKMTKNIFVPKLIFDIRDNRLLSFREWIWFNHHFSYAEDCEVEGFKIIHNTPEDIIAATEELEARLAGRWVENAEDQERQAAYHALYAPCHIGYGSTGLISSAFLKKHEGLLG